MFAKQKKCPYCQIFYILYRKDQATCGKVRCRRARKEETQRKWREKYPDYDKGRYPQLEGWREEHPDYLQKYRKTHPDYERRNRIKQKERRERRKSVDIQTF